MSYRYGADFESLTLSQTPAETERPSHGVPVYFPGNAATKLLCVSGLARADGRTRQRSG